MQQLEYTTNNTTYNTVALYGAEVPVPQAVSDEPLSLDVGAVPTAGDEIPLRIVAGNEIQTVAESRPEALVLASDALVEPALRSEHSPTSDRNFIVTGITEVVDEAQSPPALGEASAAGPALPAPSPVLTIQDRPRSNQHAPSGSRPPSPIDGPSRKASKRSRDDGENSNDPIPADLDQLQVYLAQPIPRGIRQVLLGQGADDTSQSGDPDAWALVPRTEAE